MAAIPALIDRTPGAPDIALTQSLAILEFLEEVAPTPAILPHGPLRPGSRPQPGAAAGRRHASIHYPARAQSA